MFSLVQNFICTKDSRLEVVKRNSVKLGDTFPDTDFYINYNSENNNFGIIRDSYKENISKINFYNELTKDWALVTLSLVKQVKTPYVMFICEDMEVNCSKEHMESTLSEFFDKDFPFEYAYDDKWTSKDYIDILAPKIVEKCLSDETGVCHVGSKRRTFYEIAKGRNPNVKRGKRNKNDLKDTSFYG